MRDWTYNELKHVGVDYSMKSSGDEYDNQMDSFRNYEKEVEDFLDKVRFSNPGGLTAIDLGCGTGAFSIHAAKHFKKIYALDVSEEMLNKAKSKASKNNIKNIDFVNSGFLQYQPDEEVDFIFTKWAFHHLPDYWKQAGLLNMNRMLKQDGILFISDVVFKFEPDYEEKVDALIDEVTKQLGKDFAAETKVHIKEEFSTFDWVLRGLIERAGFRVEWFDTKDCLASEYLCRKIKSVDELSADSA